MPANFINGSAGTIDRAVFVVQSTTVDKAVDQASGTSTFIIGISQEFSGLAQQGSNSLVAATSQGDPILVYQVGQVCLLQSTSAGWSSGAYLTATTGGKGITATSGQLFGARALTAATTVGMFQVEVLNGVV